MSEQRTADDRCMHGKLIYELCELCEAGAFAGEHTGFAPVRQQFSKEQLQERAKEFMRIHFGNVRQMQPAEQRAYHETSGILMFYIDHVWKPFS